MPRGSVAIVEVLASTLTDRAGAHEDQGFRGNRGEARVPPGAPLALLARDLHGVEATAAHGEDGPP